LAGTEALSRFIASVVSVVPTFRKTTAHGIQGQQGGALGLSGHACHDPRQVAKLKQQSRSLDETIAAKPTAAFDAKWGQFVITPAFFTRLVYQGV
jgi:hypothetical protein